MRECIVTTAETPTPTRGHHRRTLEQPAFRSESISKANPGNLTAQ
ncbi:MAG: hypothetical protein QGH60_01705 [Phycisphaerae bacterium]|nr:hypothetical protein [Phycisphaerae bacterium]